MKDNVTTSALETPVGVNLIHQQLSREARGMTVKRTKAMLSPLQWSMFQRSGKTKGILGRGSINRRIIASKTVGTQKTEFHATKGRRTYQVPA